jgi:hypothetical protein
MNENLSASEQQRAIECVGYFALLRSKGCADEKIAEEIGFGSAEAMRIQLRSWGLPGWMVGEPERDAAPKARKARAGAGKPVELPPAKNAISLFKSELQRLFDEVDRLPWRRESLQDGRFVVAQKYDASPETSSEDQVFAPVERGDASAEEWREFCKEHGHDPSQEIVYQPVTLVMQPRGASPVPPEPLGTLISLHVLRGGTLKELIDALHPDPENADTEQLEGIVDRLEKESRRLATGVRGGNVRTGRKAAPLPELEHALAVHIRSRRGEGASDKQIRKEISETLPGDAQLTEKEMTRLGNLQLE